MHQTKVCEHGKFITTCRCPGPKVTTVVKPCPFPSHANIEEYVGKHRKPGTPRRRRLRGA